MNSVPSFMWDRTNTSWSLISYSFCWTVSAKTKVLRLHYFYWLLHVSTFLCLMQFCTVLAQSRLFRQPACECNLQVCWRWAIRCSLSACLVLDRPPRFFPLWKLPDSHSSPFSDRISTSCSSEKQEQKKTSAEYLDASDRNELIGSLCLRMSVCCEAGRSRADSPRHMVHPGKRLEIHVFGKLLSCHLAPATRKVMGRGMRLVWGGWAGTLERPVPPTFITGSPVSASNQISAESPTKTWLKAGLLAFY